MSNIKLSTKDAILEKALKMFNQYGIEYVGVRELAKELNMKGGNITYYFPTKDQLIVEIAKKLGEANNAIIVKKQSITLAEFLDIIRQAFSNHYKFRSLFLSMPNLMKQNRELRQQYNRRQLLRKETLVDQLNDLSKNGYLVSINDTEMEELYDTMLIIIRFWVSNASVEENLEPVDACISKYLRLIARQLRLIATPKGKKQLDQYVYE